MKRSKNVLFTSTYAGSFIPCPNCVVMNMAHAVATSELPNHRQFERINIEQRDPMVSVMSKEAQKRGLGGLNVPSLMHKGKLVMGHRGESHARGYIDKMVKRD